MQSGIITSKDIEKFGLYLSDTEKSANTVEKYLRDLRRFMRYMSDRAVEKTDVLEYKRELCERYAPRSVNSILSALNAFFVFMQRYELKVKALKIQRRIFADKERELSKADYERLLSAAKKRKNQRLYYLIQTIACTGLRVSELKYITVSAISCGKATISCKGKIRQILLPKPLCRALKRYAESLGIKSGSVFVTRRKTPLDRSNIWRMLKDLCKSARVAREKVFPHNLRHLFARTFYSVQKDIVRLADILGHSSVNTTRIYTMETGEIHQMQIQRLGLLRC